MSHGTCEIENCWGRVKARGFCNKHYRRFRSYGDPLGLSPRELMMIGSCDVEGCKSPKERRGWCNRHYRKWQRYGAPTAGREHTKYKTPEESFAARTTWDGECLVWTGRTKLEFGYGVITVGPYKAIPAHRWAWEKVHGSIPEGMVMDHMCWNPACVRVEHLRLVTQGQNTQNRQGANPNNRSSGIRGVTLCNRTGRWLATISMNNQTVNIGRYDTKEEAGEAARLARLRHYTHSDSDRRPTSGECESAGQEILNADYLYDQ